MEYVTIGLFIFSLVIIYLTKRFMATENIYKKSILLGCPAMTNKKKLKIMKRNKNAYMIFNQFHSQNQFIMKSGQIIDGHYFILSGELGIYYNNAGDKGLQILKQGICEECNTGICNNIIYNTRDSNFNCTDINNPRYTSSRYSNKHISNSINQNNYHNCCHVEFLRKMGPGSLVYNCFDLLEIHTKILKITLSDCVFTSLPIGRSEIDSGIFEKCCVEPLWKYFGCIDVLLEMGRIVTDNFIEFIIKCGLKDNPVSLKLIKGKTLRLINRLVYVESGCLRVGRVLFKSNNLLGYMEFIFGNHRGAEECESIEDSIIWFIDYNEITKRPLLDISLLFTKWSVTNENNNLENMASNHTSFNSSKFKNMNCETNFTSITLNNTEISKTISINEKFNNLPILEGKSKQFRLFPIDYSGDEWIHEKLVTIIGATSEWIWLEPHQTLVEQDELCSGVYLVGDVEIGNKECIRRQSLENGYVTDKQCSIVRIDRIAVDYMIRHVVGFYEGLMEKMTINRTQTRSLVLLITPAKRECYNFVRRLHNVLGDAAVMVRRTDVLKILGEETDRKLCEFLVAEYLERLRRTYRVVIVYIENEWSRMLGFFGEISDLIYIVGYEQVTNRFNRKEVEFIQLHKSRVGAEKLSKKIKRMLSDSSKKKTTIWDERKNNTHTSFYKRIHHILCSSVAVEKSLNDMRRLTRYLLNEKVGLVLGGGGARGFAHIGVLRALEEEGIPVDCVGGTSMGSLVGALYAQKLDLHRVYRECKKIAAVGSSFWKICFDFTYPFVSLSSGRILAKTLRSVFKNAKIQNLWLKFYCVTTNLLSQEEKVVFSGTVWKWVLASMSICGYLPPMEIDRNYYVDGAYMNNVPADVMLSLNTDIVIAVDVSNWPSVQFDSYDSSSGLFLLFKHLIGYKSYLSLKDIQYRLAFLSTEPKIKLLKSTTLLIVPELDMYKSTDFKKFDEIVACGYEAGKKAIREWKAKGLFKNIDKLDSEII